MPGGSGTITRTARCGHDCALAGADGKASALKSARASVVRSIMAMASLLRVCFTVRRVATALASAGAGTGVGAIAIDEKDEQIEEKLPLGRRQRSKHALVGGAGLGTNP